MAAAYIPPQVAAQDDDVSLTASQPWPPASPPPSFRSRASSPAATAQRPLVTAEDAPTHHHHVPTHDQDRTLADTFDSDSDGDEDGDGRDDRQRLMRGVPPSADDDPPLPGSIQRRVTELPAFDVQAPSAAGRVYGGGNGGVWANLSAKPTRGEDAEEKPPVRCGNMQSQPRNA